jgi:hypothetical protein
MLMFGIHYKVKKLSQSVSPLMCNCPGVKCNAWTCHCKWLGCHCKAHWAMRLAYKQTAPTTVNARAYHSSHPFSSEERRHVVISDPALPRCLLSTASCWENHLRQKRKRGKMSCHKISELFELQWLRMGQVKLVLKWDVVGMIWEELSKWGR